MTFATYVDAPTPARSQRLLLASVIACTSLAFATTIALTLERMSILRMPGPKTSYELAAVTIAEPPPPPPVPPKPEEIAGAVGGEGGLTIEDDDDPVPAIVEIADPPRGDSTIGSDSSGKPGIPGGRTGTGMPCPGGVCGKGAIGIPGGQCIGSNCKTASKQPPPKPVSFESLGCIACVEPSDASLRRTAAGMRKSAGTNVTRFCVDATGHVEPASVKTETSHGDPAIDRLCRDAVKGWRFSPVEVAGEARRACSEATFRIRFE